MWKDRAEWVSGLKELRHDTRQAAEQTFEAMENIEKENETA